MTESNITRTQLLSLVKYNHITGEFISLRDSGPACFGEPVGSINNKGYLMIGLMGKQYQAHRLAWLYHYGEHPEAEIDHINRNKTDNRISNLRDVSRAHNAQNMGFIDGPKRKNKSGVIGVSWNKQKRKWAANITYFGKRKFLGYFTCLEDARKCRELAKLKYHI